MHGDLHLTEAKQRNFLDFLAIVAQIEMECARTIDFVVLPGDNADNGRPWQYSLAATALKMLSVPVHAIPGDHDMEQGGLQAFYAGLGVEPLPDVSGRPGQHTIRPATRAYRPPARSRNGSDAASVGAWPENGIFGTQLGPNRNGKPAR